MKSPEYVAHGTASEKDAKGIETEGFKAEEGRATVSSNLIYAYEWATDISRRRGSKSESTPEENEDGRIVIMKIPDDKRADYATHSDIEVNNEKKEVAGYVDKYISGKKQLAVYGSENPKVRKEEIEDAKKEVALLKKEAEDYLKGVGINPEGLSSRKDLFEYLKSFEIDKRLEIIKTIEEYDKKILSKRKEAETPLAINQESILMSVRPSKELGHELERLKTEVVNLKNPNLEDYLDNISNIVENDKINYIGTEKIRDVLKNLLESTVESVVINHIRTLAMDVKRAKGYKFKDRGDVTYPDKEVNPHELKAKLEAIKEKINKEGFSLESETLTRYIKTNVDGLLRELE